mmetsp:Transcript_20270/g.24217  ORF Transcript_20270/g.24217 Transcript_20270/m.24217 type:complete len:996 (-) Transcript_20270:325-3312(-)|eukprot:CAMPEP_0197860374 /NCGR_PEP_ID=MMETSP1438-20131217/35681_1 /TAXON_ID=1461541 /ORGANISM="Pterosperma sp., Strain CCMP1384" /LENGTH=995 /DNA_ID=CAMNT_0043477205 /DNA_START=188 /DNA_END=3175 /DNA_ORIENTATION=+
MPGIKLTSANGLLALLDEEHDGLKVHALKGLLTVVDDHWAEVASSISVVEALYEDEEFEQRQTAALLASKVFYHLGELDDSLQYALGAGDLFDVNETSEYVQTLLAKAIDEYVSQRVQAEGEEEESEEKATRLTAIVERMFERCFRDGQYRQAIGVALEARRMDKLADAIMKSDNVADSLAYTMKASLKLVTSREFRQKVLKVLVGLYESSSIKDYSSVCTCLMFLEDHAAVADILDKLILGTEDESLLAYQIAYDLFENEIHQFLVKTRDRIAVRATPPAPPAPPAPQPEPTPDGAEPTAEEAAAAGETEGGEAAMEEDTPAETKPTAVPAVEPSEMEPRHTSEYQSRWTKLNQILSGESTIGLHLQFLVSHNHSDLLILKNIRNAVEKRNSVCHSATVLANSIMHAGTTVDTFLRDNLEWVKRATNWAKFSVVAGLGVIHRGHLSQSRALMRPHLPPDSNSPYSEGGALYALGLVHVDHGEDIRPFLTESLRNATNEVVQHGACLGLGLAVMGCGDDDLYEDFKGVLYSDNAVAGEAAGIGLGLMYAGSMSDVTGEMLEYAHSTQHEKIIRGLAMGCALIVYGHEEEADTLIEQMCRDADPIIRYGGMFAIATAYRGTANNSAIRRLLHFAVSDVNDDVRRAAIIAIGFVLFLVPEQCPRVVALLAESYNPHMRYGAAIAVGVSCSGTGLKEAVAILEPLTTDAVDYVRQGAAIAMAMVLIQQPESRTSSFRKQLEKVVNDKHEDIMAKMGAIMASGILDAGGRNMTIGLRSRSGNTRMNSVLGMVMFIQYWYWYPLSYFISLPLTTTALIGLNGDLVMPKFSVTSHCKPSLFAYPTPKSDEKSDKVVKAPTAVLSTTAKARAKAKASKDAKEGEKAEGKDGEAMETDGEGKSERAAAHEEAEPTSEQLENPARIVPAQEKYVSFQEGIGVRYTAVKRNQASGIVVLKDGCPELPVELVELFPTNSVNPATPAPVAEEEEAPPPEPFEFTPVA